MELIGHGAEAKVYKMTNQNQNNEKQFRVIKERLPKRYRHPDLDKKINEARIKSQSKIMQKLLKKGIKVPKILKVNQEQYQIVMQFIDGIKLRDYLNNQQLQQEKIQNVLRQIGDLVRRVHETGIIHGDLTTSNMIYMQGEIYLLDFGLSYFKETAQDRAVDLYVLERAFKSTHPRLQNDFDKILIAYQNEAALKKLQVVRQRGRKKIAFG